MAAGPSMALRFHPQIDVRSAGDLLFRAGFSMPVADQETISVSYSSFQNLRDDVIANGAANALSEIRPFSRQSYATVRQQFDRGAQETYAPIFMTGWAPEAGEQRPSGPTKGFRSGA